VRFLLRQSPDYEKLACYRYAAAATNMNALRGAAGNLFTKLKDTTKTVVATVQQTMTTKELGTFSLSGTNKNFYLTYCFRRLHKESSVADPDLLNPNRIWIQTIRCIWIGIKTKIVGDKKFTDII
jgi:hypothetical protein